jgi:myosin heavy chain 6/7
VWLQVPYNIAGWLEKNKDPLNDTVVDQYKRGNNPLVVVLYGDHPGQSGTPTAGGDDGGKGGKGTIFYHYPMPSLPFLFRSHNQV